ncbi:COG1470 family protein [Streptomyces sp. NPDC002623]
MTTAASLDTTAVTAEPGGLIQVPLQVRNSGSTVEEYRFEVVGPAAAWATVEPTSLSLYPDSTGTAVLALSPPRSPDVPAGDLPFGVRVVPTSAPDTTVVPEGVVTVLPFAEITGELVPRGFDGAWRGRTDVAIDNRGNIPMTVQLAAQGDSSRVRLGFARETVELPPGAAELTRLTARPARRLWRGAPVVHPFQVVANPTGEAPHESVALDGTYQQDAILPRWLPRALLAVVAVAATLAIVWFALLRPVVRSAAREESQKQVAAVLSPSPGASGAASGGGSGGASAGSSGTGGDTAGGGSPSSGAAAGSNAGSTGGGSGGSGSGGGTGGSGGGGAVDPRSAQTAVKDSVGSGSTADTVYRVPAGQVFDLTDLVVQNPQGDSGTVVIAAGSRTLLTLALQNFRDQDYHFVTPIAVPAGGRITMTVTCSEVGRPVGGPTPAQCDESVLVGGTLRQAPSASPSPSTA